MQPDRETIEEITREVFASVVGIDVASGGRAPDEPLLFTVDVTGPWSGSIHLEIGASCARTLAGAMFAQEEVTTDDVQDAMGELANVIGGSVKGLMPGPSKLSLPRHGGAVGDSATPHSFTWGEHSFRVVISNPTPTSHP